MKISDNRKLQVYKAICNPITDLRIDVEKDERINKVKIDKLLYYLEIEIAHRVWKALNIQEDK
jgi:hypothetical protein